jgi:hypothetical protein
MGDPMHLRVPLAVIAISLLAACAESVDAERERIEDRETVFDPLTETLDRAAGVEDTVRQQAEETRRRIEEAEGR